MELSVRKLYHVTKIVAQFPVIESIESRTATEFSKKQQKE